MAVKYIQSEIVKAESTGQVSQWNSIKKQCVQVSANSVWHTHGQWAFMCLTEDTTNNKNPFDQSDVAFKADFDIPTIVGRTHCNWSDTKKLSRVIQDGEQAQMIMKHQYLNSHN